MHARPFPARALAATLLAAVAVLGCAPADQHAGDTVPVGTTSPAGPTTAPATTTAPGPGGAGTATTSHPAAGPTTTTTATPATTRPAPAGGATKILIVSPRDATGGPRPGLHVVQELHGGECTPGGSQQVVGAFRCMSGDGVADPCWSTPATGASAVLCLVEPWSDDAYRIDGVTGLDGPAGDVGGDDGPPWGVELATGARCELLTGAHSVLAGRAIDYSCSDGHVVLRDLDRSHPVWKADTATGGPTPVAGPAVEVRTAWFGRG
jgi:hypothetical protein